APRTGPADAAGSARRRRRPGRGAVPLPHAEKPRRCHGRASEMITKITGALVRVLDEEVRLAAGALEYAVLVPEFVRRQLQTRLGDEVGLHTSHFLEGKQM